MKNIPKTQKDTIRVTEQLGLRLPHLVMTPDDLVISTEDICQFHQAMPAQEMLSFSEFYI